MQQLHIPRVRSYRRYEYSRVGQRPGFGLLLPTSDFRRERRISVLIVRRSVDSLGGIFTGFNYDFFRTSSIVRICLSCCLPAGGIADKSVIASSFKSTCPPAETSRASA